jgi:hypothetical protein
MPALVPAALALAVALSAIGAVVLCMLVVAYGFTPAGEESPLAASRRLLLTRIGHAVAAVCFTATAVLISVALAQPARLPVPEPLADPRVPALDSRRLDVEAHLAKTQARIDELEDAARRAAAEARAAAEQAIAERRATAAVERAARQRAVGLDGSVRERAAWTRRPTDPRSASIADPAPTTPAPSPPPPAPSALVAPSPPVAATPPPPPPRPSTTASPTTLAETPPPVRTPAAPPGVMPAPATPPPARPTSSTPATEVVPAREPAVEPGAPPGRRGLWSRLQEDWKTIRHAFESGEEDFRTAVDETRRKFRKLLGH